jgi:hypothetical protein
MPQTFITQKTTPENQRLLRLIAAATGEKQYATLTRLLTQEWERLQRLAPPKES